MSKCIECAAELSPGFAFCPRCGSRQPTFCPACGFACEPDFAFCPGCGTARAGAPGRNAPRAPPVRQAPAAAVREARPRDTDRRQVTVLFADLTGFTSLSERLDAEDVRNFQDALFAALRESVARFGGFVAKFLGDAVLAVFGAPVAHEDDPARALDAALDMLARSEALGAQWAGRLGQPVLLHIAVHTGPVVAGSFAEAAYDITGDTVNTAARLLGAAAPGTILVSDATHALTCHRFAFDRPDRLELRGRSGPVVVHRLDGRLPEPMPERGLSAYGLASPMVGRGQELRQLLAAFDQMHQGRAQFVSVAGEAGTGKSRLISEFLGHVADDPRFHRTTLRRTSCSSLGEPSYGVFAALFRQGYQVSPEDSLDVARGKLLEGLRSLARASELTDTVVPVLGSVLGIEDGGQPDLDPEQLKRQIALAARLLVERRVEEGPVLMIVEDLHWADAASVDLLRELADGLADRPLMMLFSHRPDLLPPVTAKASQSIIRLPPLSRQEVGAFVSGLFGSIEPAALARVEALLAERAGGNPLFAEEIVRTLVSTGILVREGGRWTCTGACDGVRIPPTLHGLLLSRIDRLPPEARRLLQEAAVLGVTFEESLLEAIATEMGHAGPVLESLVAADLLTRLGHSREQRRYRFTHALVHEVVYENLLVARRCELHERAARALERSFGPQPTRLADLEALGHHWSLTSDRLRGARYLIAAGDRARAVYANDDAIRNYERALRTLAGCEACAAESCDARERLADVLALTGHRADALSHYEEVRDCLQSAGRPAGVARLHRKIAALHWDAGDRERARTCLAAGLASLGEQGSRIERAHLFQELGRLAFRVGDNQAAIAWAERALAEAGRGSPDADEEDPVRRTASVRVQASNTLGVALARLGRLEDAAERIGESVRLAQEHDLLQAACRGYANLGVLLTSLDPRRSIETSLRGLEAARRIGDLGFQSRLYANLAVAYCALTNRCELEGVDAAQRSVEIDRRLGLLDHLPVPLIVLGQIHHCHGDRAAAREAYEEALSLAEAVGEPQLLFPCLDGLATLHLDAGNVEMAETFLARAQELCEKAGLDPDALLILPFLT